MDLEEARSYLNHLLTLNLRQEESFGPLAYTFWKDHDLEKIGLLPEERFSLLMGTIQSIAAEPKRYSIKLELLQKAKALVPQTRYANPQLAQELDYDIKKTTAELDIYNTAMRPEARQEGVDYTYSIAVTGLPVLENSMVFMGCEVIGSHVYGDHTLYLAEVKEVRQNEHAVPPLMFFRSRWYHPAEG